METYQNALTKEALILTVAQISHYGHILKEYPGGIESVAFVIAALVANNTHSSGQHPQGASPTNLQIELQLCEDMPYSKRFLLAKRYVEKRWDRKEPRDSLDIAKFLGIPQEGPSLANPISEATEYPEIVKALDAAKVSKDVDFYPLHVWQVYRRGSFESMPILVMAPDEKEAREAAFKNAPLGAQHRLGSQSELMVLQQNRGTLHPWVCYVDHVSMNAIKAHGCVVQAVNDLEAARIVRWCYLIPDSITITMHIRNARSEGGF